MLIAVSTYNFFIQYYYSDSSLPRLSLNHDYNSIKENGLRIDNKDIKMIKLDDSRSKIYQIG